MPQNNLKQIIKSIGLVFGDIGTSPIYTLTIAFLFLKPTHDNVLGIVSLIIWALILIVFIEYVILAMSLGIKGEGGTVVLRETLTRYLKKPSQKQALAIITFIGISFLIGDGVITPAISILSAVEGLIVLPALTQVPQFVLLIAASLIAFSLFSFQHRGTDKVAKTFGPIMIVWFASLAISGFIIIFHEPSVLQAINPYFALKFIFSNGYTGLMALSIVFLCVTGSEALFADMGHLGRKPIIHAWYFVFIAIVLNYLGQGAFLLNHNVNKFVLFEMIYSINHYLYIPFLLLCVAATIIASQAMISGMFSMVFQAIQTRIMPLFKINYTSTEMRSQIYIPAVNWFLFVFVVIIIWFFKESSNLGEAYGLAVSGNITITGIIICLIFYFKKNYLYLSLAIFVTAIDVIFLISNMTKIPHGAYWSIIISSLPLLLILTYNIGNKRLYKALKPAELNDFLKTYNEVYQNSKKIKGSAIFLIRDIKRIPPYISLIFFVNSIVYQDNIFLSITNTSEPFGINSRFKESPAPGIRVFEIQSGYMEFLNMEKLLKQASINPKVIFYGIEEISTNNLLMKVFAAIKNLAPSFVQFYKLPTNKVHGVITRLEI